MVAEPWSDNINKSRNRQQGQQGALLFAQWEPDQSGILVSDLQIS